ncbi:unnamed protein product [Penicillium salamii]|uniref:GXWXG domain-containing protein n=1 Tax=Penicillium salamii TaxID=1612424 RepID=A0A9W4NHU5_9EURO|nr:unnamed protein product [Penicillium salamii]CAG8357005.1 unnamed protein product [Penicillium salamii]CAG8368622.1 unnamed protein product [Penicillium salamii]CAG8398770.1 unnamed protein product [Penicillium salamii]
MSLSPEQHYEQLVIGRNLKAQDVQAAFDNLQPIKPESFVEAWKGANVNTGHPTEEKLTGMRWAGKTFRSTEDVDPIMVYDNDGRRVSNADWGHARLRQIEWNGKVSTAMVYDDFPIIDYFRYVKEDLIAGAMDAKTASGGTYYFYLFE